MRTIKFRVWTEGCKDEPYYTKDLYWVDDARDLFYLWCLKPECIEQFTGLYDKNGKEIYEGDLFLDDGEYYVIKQPSGGVGLYLCHIDDNHGDDLNHYYFNQMEVVGNIHENKIQ